MKSELLISFLATERKFGVFSSIFCQNKVSTFACTCGSKFSGGTHGPSHCHIVRFKQKACPKNLKDWHWQILKWCNALSQIVSCAKKAFLDRQKFLDSWGLVRKHAFHCFTSFTNMHICFSLTNYGLKYGSPERMHSRTVCICLTFLHCACSQDVSPTTAGELLLVAVSVFTSLFQC